MKYTLEQCVEMAKQNANDYSYDDLGRQKDSDDFFEKYGFRREDTWNLDYSILIYILPRLAYLRDTCIGCPVSLGEDGTMEEWKNILDKIVTGIYKCLEADGYYKEENAESIKEAGELMLKYFGDLWD